MTARGDTNRSKDRWSRAVYEPIVPLPSESFVWRCDDYPLPWCVWNYHPECEIHLIRKTTGICYVGDHIGSFSPGSLYLVGKNLPHDWVTPLERAEVVAGRDVLIQFDPDRHLAASDTLPELKRIAPLLRMAERGMSFHGRTCEDGAALVEAVGRASGLKRFTLFLSLLDVLATAEDYTLLSSEDFSPNLDEAVNRILRDVLGRLASRCHEDVRLADMADVAGMTETSFSRFFKKNTGNTFTRHLGELRIGKACQLLSDTDKAVTEICHDVGYENISNFNKIFRELRGLTPREYRRLAGSRRSKAFPAVHRGGRPAPAGEGQDTIGIGRRER